MNDIQLTFMVAAGLAFILAQIPIIGSYASVFQTLIHEVGHAAMALLTGGRVSRIELFANTEGTAWSSHRFKIGKILTSLAGYPAATLASVGMIMMLLSGDEKLLMQLITGLLLVSLLLWIRNLYGLLWIGTFLAGCGALWYTQNPKAITYAAWILSAIVWSQALSSAFDILKLSIKSPNQAGDAKNLAKSTWIPTLFWGLLFMIQALLGFGYGLFLILTNDV